MNLKYIKMDDLMRDLPETFNSNMKEIEKLLNVILSEISCIKDDIAHLKIITRED